MSSTLGTNALTSHGAFTSGRSSSCSIIDKANSTPNRTQGCPPNPSITDSYSNSPFKLEQADNADTNDSVPNDSIGAASPKPTRPSSSLSRIKMPDRVRIESEAVWYALAKDRRYALNSNSTMGCDSIHHLAIKPSFLSRTTQNT